MIKKRFFATVTAAAMMTSLFSMTAFAGATTPTWGQNGGTKDLVGESEAVNPVIEVAAPENLNFYLNPFRLNIDEDAEGKAEPQIVSGDFAVTNLSAIPVEVKVSTKLENAADVTPLAADALTFDTDTHELLGTSQAKTVAVGQAFAKGATANAETGEFTYTYADGTEIAYDKIKNEASAKTANTFILGSTAQDAIFILKGAEQTGITDYSVCTMAFKMIGAMDPDTKDQYKNKDVTVKCTYTLKHLTDNMYANGYDNPDVLTDALNNKKAK